MKKGYLKVISVSAFLLSLSPFIGGCGKEYKVTFVNENSSDIVRYVKKGETLTDIPDAPQVKYKYCLWDEVDLTNIEEDIVVHASCYSSVSNLSSNLARNINVTIGSNEAELSYILKDLELEATFDDGTRKVLYEGDYSLDTGGYDKNKSGTYKFTITYNNAKYESNVNVNKIDNYVTVSLYNNQGYYNEGLPALAVYGGVRGEARFDPNQTLVVGEKAYSWTFTPEDTNKYAVMSGRLNVNLLDASELVANKSTINFDYGVTKQEIINEIKKDLVVKGKYGNVYRDIDAKYYTIDSTDFVTNYSGDFNFIIRYGQTVYTTVVAHVNKCDTYSLSVDDVDEFIIQDGSDVSDLLEVVNYDSDIEGTLSLEEQILTPGTYHYNYSFTPSNSHYATKEGQIVVKLYRAIDYVINTQNEFEFGSELIDIKAAILENLTGQIIYNDDYAKDIDNTLVVGNIEVPAYNKNTPGTYIYSFNYNDEIVINGEFSLAKKELVNEVDYQINLGTVDPTNYELMPTCTITRKPGASIEFDASKFTFVQLADGEREEIAPGFYEYTYSAALVPDESIADTFATVNVTIVIIS